MSHPEEFANRKSTTKKEALFVGTAELNSFCFCGRLTWDRMSRISTSILQKQLRISLKRPNFRCAILEARQENKYMKQGKTERWDFFFFKNSMKR